MTAIAHLKGGPGDGKTVEVIMLTRVLRYAGDEQDNAEYVRVHRDSDDSATYEWRTRDG